jgi:hypothetical protein
MATKKLAKKNQAEMVMPLKDLVYAFIEARDKVNALQEQTKPYKEAKEAIQAKIIEVFKGRGEYSTRLDGATVSLSVRKTAVVVDEQRVIAQLKEAGLQQYISESLNDLFDGPKKDIASGKAPLLEGMAIKETEFVSVRENEKDDARKVVTQDFKKVEGGVYGK